MSELRLLTIGQVRGMTALGASTIYRRMDTGTFPRPLSLGPTGVRWLHSDVQDWIKSLNIAGPAGRRGRPLKLAPAYNGAGNGESEATNSQP